MATNRILLVPVCLALASCMQPRVATESTVETFDTCAGNVIDNTCRRIGGITRCHVLVIQRPGQAPEVRPQTLMTPGPTIGASAPTTVIVWHVIGQGHFRDRADGPILAAPSVEFSDPTPSSDFDGDLVAPASSPHFRLRYLNSTVGSYKYTIKFVNSEGNVVTCDPKITNSAG